VRDSSEIASATPEDLDEEELLYNRKINELRNLKEMKISQLEMMKVMQSNASFESEEHKTLQAELNTLIQEKDRLGDILRANREAVEDRIRQIEQFSDDLVKIDRAIQRRVERLNEYNLEIDVAKRKIEEHIEMQREREQQ
jgi:chromosome segregation ATPase